MKPADTAHARAYWSQVPPHPADGHAARLAIAPRTPPTIKLHGIAINITNEQQCVQHIVDCASQGQGGWVVTPNLDIMRQCTRDASLAQMIASADLVIADGMPLVWASRLQRTPLPGRVAGSTLMVTLCENAARHGLRVFLLGGAPGIADTAASVLQQRHAGLRIAGTCCPPLGFEHDDREINNITHALTRATPDIVFVALGFPKQEQLIMRLRHLLPHAWWLGVGIGFSFVAGDVARAPVWIQRIGLEWLHRLAQEPRRLAKRYLLDDLPFAASFLARSAWRGVAKSDAPDR